ncbi:MAG: DUF4412 domain-containing protein [Candidatus Margulisbacteria bacterium]|nr:DUF4412 domain-containing protein [Candidatus Margulisiibacteriota bacterium]
MSNKTLWLSVILSVVLAGSALARDFSADAVTKTKRETFQSKIYFSGDNKFRMEMQKAGMRSISIGRLDKKIMWMIMPDTKMYMEMSMPDQQARGMSAKMAGEVDRKKVGRENINGIGCDKYEVTIPNKSTGGKDVIYQWISDDKIPVKTEAKDGSWSTEFKNISRASQPGSLFEVPAGYTKQSMPDMSKMMGPGAKRPMDYRNMMKGMPGH